MLLVQLYYTIEAEMVVKPVDFFIRRTGDMFFHISNVRKWKESILAAMADRMGWTAEQQTMYSRELEEKLAEAVEPMSE